MTVLIVPFSGSDRWVGVRKYGKLVDGFKAYPPEEAQSWKIITCIINGKIAKIITD
jgi:hypothetical protein